MNITLFVPVACRTPTWLHAFLRSSAVRSLKPLEPCLDGYDVEFLRRVRTTLRAVRNERHRSLALRGAAAGLIASASAASSSLVSPSARACRGCVEYRRIETVEAPTTTP